jgi:MFS family permease
MRALKHRNFSLFWWGALVSNTGTWVQNVTVPFVIFQITGSPAWVGFATFAQFFPALLMGPAGGVIADRFPRRTVLIVAQVGMALVAFGLWGAWLAGVRSPWALVAIVSVSGAIAGLSIGAWQAFVSELVPREDLLNAVTLNSAQFSGARAFGPFVGGIVLATLGPSWSFFINGVSFAAVIGALLLIRVPRIVEPSNERPRVFAELGSTMRYVRTMPGIVVSIAVVLALGALGSPVFSLIVVFADEVFHVGEAEFGVLSASLGIGAIVGMPIIAGPGSALPRSRMVTIALPIYGGALMGFALAPNHWFGVVALIVAGAGYLAIASTLNTTIQLQVDEGMRGKVLAFYVMGITGTAPLGALIQGWAADVVGPRQTVAAAGAMFVILALALQSTGRVRHLDEEADVESAGDGGGAAVDGAAGTSVPR